MARTLEQVHSEMQWHADQIERMFRSGAKVTIIVRNPSIEDADTLVTKDDIDAVVDAIRSLQAQEPPHAS